MYRSSNNQRQYTAKDICQHAVLHAEHHRRDEGDNQECHSRWRDTQRLRRGVCSDGEVSRGERPHEGLRCEARAKIKEQRAKIRDKPVLKTPNYIPNKKEQGFSLLFLFLCSVYNSAISLSTSSGRVAQLVARRTTVRPSSRCSHSLNDVTRRRRCNCSSSSTKNI